MDIASIGAILGGAGQAAGGIASLLRPPQTTPDNSTFYQNWRNDDMAWSREQFDRNEALQREFAQNGVRWRVEDAKAAGLHPLAAIGAAGSSYSPTVTAGGGNYNVDQGRSYDNRDIGASLSNMGQGLGRAVAATQTPQERIQTASQIIREQQGVQMGDQQIKMNDLNLAIAASKLAMMQQGAGPGFPSSGVAPGGSPETQVIRDTQGGMTTHPSKDSKAEDEFGAPLMAETLYKNRLLPMVGAAPPAEVIKAIKQAYPGATGAYWDHLKFGWHPTYHPSGEGALRRYTKGRQSYEGYQLPNNSPRTYYGE